MPGKFALGRTVITRGAFEALTPRETLTAFVRHARGDWGDVCEEDRLANERSLQTGSRLLSRYASSGGETFWVITEADRSVTTIILPGEY